MNGALDDAAFLANSANRVAVLEALTERSLRRDELLDRLDLSRVTLARILSDLESRHWVERSGHTWAATPLGVWVSEEFNGLLETIAEERRLRAIVPWFPADRVPFDVRSLREATIVVPTRNDITAHVQRSAICLRTARRVRVLSAQTAPSFIEATRDAAADHAQRFEGVLTRDLVDRILTDPAVAPLFLELLEASRVDVYTHGADPPVTFFIADETVGLSLTDEDGVMRAIVLSEDDVIYDWAARTFRRYRTRAEAITPETLPA
ncbi:helix-turn-helix transcriptional regulator [Natrononativus amylolyticus]|uniref:helix-turn-helix transcriptional regulator n=1 Tax=Natrononativus amylolyticus TaxID=2963434 RepID=UPI0020CD4CEC|nr:hypothetical protein [Natrononativus amylolyticus]